MKNEKEWIDNLRNRMKGYSEPVPEGLWEELEKELGGQTTPKVIPLWKRWQVAAAVLVLLASSLTYWFWSSPEVDFHSQKLAVEVKDTPLPEKTYVRNPQPERESVQMTEKPESPLLVEAARERVANQIEKLDSVSTASEVGGREEETELPENEVAEQAVPEEAETVNTEAGQHRDLRASRAADQERMQQNVKEVQEKASKTSGFSLGVGAGNTPYSSMNTFEGMGSFVARSVYYTSSDLNMAPVNNGGLAYSQILLENATQTPQTSIKHHMPVTVGLSLAWNLNEDWALETGLNYTLLSSDIHSGAKSYVEEQQKLHYVGIPLKVRRSIWRNRWLSVYASVGGAVEKCVSGTLESVTVTNGGRTSEQSSLEVDPLQWSVTAAAGAQVNFTSRLGLYVEPGMAYYFDDHSNVETIRKEHPFNFNFQLGLRFNVIK